MKTINFELSKRLNELGLLDDIDTEYYIDEENTIYSNSCIGYEDAYIVKTLSLEEALEFLKNEIWIACDFSIRNVHNMWWKLEWCFEEPEPNIFIKWKTLLEAVEKMIEFLLDNNLIWKST